VTIEQEATEVTEDIEFKKPLRFLCFLLFVGLGVVIFSRRTSPPSTI